MPPDDANGAPVSGGPTQTDATSITADRTSHTSAEGGPWEYVIRWRRDAWASTTKARARTFDRPDAAWRLIDKLKRDRADLSPVTWIRLERRQVGPWAPLWGQHRDDPMIGGEW